MLEQQPHREILDGQPQTNKEAGTQANSQTYSG
jgi:hypothetical protein